MTTKVLMQPHIYNVNDQLSGIARVVEAYFKYLPDYDIELVEPDTSSYDLKASHAGITAGDNDVAHCHGLYWTADYNMHKEYYRSNKRIIDAVRHAKEVTVPSRWVAETFQRDMRLNPHVIGHGIDFEAWQHNYENQGFILWNKNRPGDVCDTTPLVELGKRFPDLTFLTTFKPKGSGGNVTEVLSGGGTIPHTEMKKLVQVSGCYLATTKETFGIGVLEAMASGIPVLGFKWGGNLETIQHGVSGYLAEPDNYEDLAQGLVYCLQNAKVLGQNGREIAKSFSWPKAVEKVAGVYRLAAKEDTPSVSVVIPVYNKPVEEVQRAIESVLNQTFPAKEIVVVIDGGIDDYSFKLGLLYKDDPIHWIIQENQGVAVARNNGIKATDSKYILCLDADDWIAEHFLEACVTELEKDRSLGIAYTGLWSHKPNGEEGLSPWPTKWDFDLQLQKRNQVPTACVFRRDMWARLGGYKQRYAPGGAGAEDAEFWTRAGAYGFKAKKVTEAGLFHYSWLSGQVTGNPNYSEPDYLAWHPWTKDDHHPFASYATPKNKISHPVRQYDDPLISVIIPVGPGHQEDVKNALDSLEGQTFRKWECIVVWDAQQAKPPGLILQAYPYVKIVYTDDMLKSKGAGFARNRGVEQARSPLILFLDADDTLHPDALSKMYQKLLKEKKAVYTDYVGQAFIEPQLAKKLQDEKRLRFYNQEDGEAIVSYQALDYNCTKAQQVPSQKPYIWNLITTLFPKRWHFEIGGFDEEMDTWEDWDYWLRMSYLGKCFVRLPEELVRYRFYTGHRREKAASNPETYLKTLEYLQRKHKDIEKMGCGCSKAKAQQVAVNGGSKMASEDFVQAVYQGSRGRHTVVGAHRFDYDPDPRISIRNGDKWKIRYGRIQNGDKVLVHQKDIELMVNKWKIEKEVQQPVFQEEIEVPTAPEPLTDEVLQWETAKAAAWQETTGLPAKVPASGNIEDLKARIKQSTEAQFKPKPVNLEKLEGTTPFVRQEMKKAGLVTKEAILKAGVEGLQEIKGIGVKRAETILKAVS